MANISTPFGALTLTAQAASTITPGTVVTAIDGAQTAQRFDPGAFVGYGNSSGPQTGDAPGLWLPTVKSASQVLAGNPNPATGQTMGTGYGPMTIVLSPPPRLVQFLTSPMVYVLAPGDLVTVATGSF